MDDDFGMELLVGGNIISLSLPVRLVWECVWRPTLPSPASEASGQLPNTYSPTHAASHYLRLQMADTLSYTCHRSITDTVYV